MEIPEEGETKESEEVENEVEENQMNENEILNDEEVEEEAFNKETNIETENVPEIRRSSRNVERIDYAALHRRGRGNFQIKIAKIFKQ